MPLSYASGNGVVYGDLYVLASYDAVVGRDVTLDKLPAQRMRVANGDYVIRSTRRITPSPTSTGIHDLHLHDAGHGQPAAKHDEPRFLRGYLHPPSTSSAFTSLMNRGFMAELEGNQTISDAVNAMYGFIKDYVMKDGPHLRAAALPATPI